MLLAREKTTPLKAVERLAGMQAQEPKPPFIGLWTRLEGFRREQLVKALSERKLVRGTGLRGTLHLVSARDYVAFRSVLEPMLERSVTSLGDRAEGLEMDEILPLARKLLKGRPQPFKELCATLQKERSHLDDRALRRAVRMELPLILVPSEDSWGFPRVADFDLAETWIGKSLKGKPAPDRLALRYLAAFGPATAADFQTWSGLQGGQALFDGLRAKLMSFEDERGRELFDLADAPRPGARASAPPRFLPEFDNLLLAHKDRSRVIADEHRSAVFTKNLRVRATFLVDGLAAGTWVVERKKRAAALQLTPFDKLSKAAVKELTTEGDKLLRFLEEDADEYEVKTG